MNSKFDRNNDFIILQLYIFYIILQNSDGTIDGLKENDLVQLVEKTCPNFKTEGLTIEQLQNLLLGGTNTFEIIRPIKKKEINAQGKCQMIILSTLHKNIS